MLDTFIPIDCSKTVKNGVGHDSRMEPCVSILRRSCIPSRVVSWCGRILLVSKYMVKGLHVNPCNTVHKEGAVKRVATDLSHGKDRVSSYNHSVDQEKHLGAYL